MASLKIEKLVESLGLNPGFWELTGQLTGRQFEISDEGQLNARTLLYDVVMEVHPDNDGSAGEDPLLLDVDEIRWDADKRRIVMVSR